MPSTSSFTSRVILYKSSNTLLISSINSSSINSLLLLNIDITDLTLENKLSKGLESLFLKYKKIEENPFSNSTSVIKFLLLGFALIEMAVGCLVICEKINMYRQEYVKRTLFM